MHDITVGDTVRVHIESPANPFGDTQMASFEVEEVYGDKVFGTDPEWGDECELIALDTGHPHYADGGKSGDVEEYHIVD